MAHNRLLTEDRLKKELQAQKARAAARAHLEATGADIRTSVDALRQKGQYTGGSLQQELNKIEGTVAGRDNTLEVLQMRRIQQTVQSKEQELKLKLAKQQEEFRQQQAGKDLARGGPEETGSLKSQTPLPPGWQEVPDPSGSGDAYFWNQRTGETTWTRPVEASKPPEPAHGGASSTPTLEASTRVATSSGDSSGSTSALPAGWKEIKHPATGQVYFFHEETKTKRWTPPTSEEDTTSDIQQRRLEVLRKAKADASAAKQKQDAGKKRQRVDTVDPLDPTGGKGNWSDGMLNMAERMADSTASGSLWQQRPLPAPGQILKSRKK